MKKHSLLLVDDEQNIINSLIRLLRKEGYRLLTANSAMEGMEILKAEEVSLIISDQRMPVMNGINFMHDVKILYPDTIRIILSGYTDVNTIISAINKGEVYKFITKPWNDEELKLTIKHSIEHFELTEENKVLVNKLKTYNEDLEKKIETRTLDLNIRNKSLLVSQSILESLPVAVIGISCDGMISLTNKAGNQAFQLTSDSILGKTFDQIFCDEINTLIKKSLDTGTDRLIKNIIINNTAFSINFIHISFPFGGKGLVVVLIKTC